MMNDPNDPNASKVNSDEMHSPFPQLLIPSTIHVSSESPNVEEQITPSPSSGNTGSFQLSMAMSALTDSMATVTMRSQPLERLVAAGAMPSFKGQARSVVCPFPIDDCPNDNDRYRSSCGGSGSFNTNQQQQQQQQYQPQPYQPHYHNQTGNNHGSGSTITSPVAIAMPDDRDSSWNQHDRTHIPVVEAFALTNESHPRAAIATATGSGNAASGSGNAASGNSSDTLYYADINHTGTGTGRYPSNQTTTTSSPRVLCNGRMDQFNDESSRDKQQQESRKQKLRSSSYVLSILMGLMLVMASLTGAICFSRDCQFMGDRRDTGSLDGDNNVSSNSTDSYNGDTVNSQNGRMSHQKTGHIVAFSNTNELYQAVDLYMAVSNDDTSSVAKQYGYPMSTWDVSQLSNFSNVFDGKRNAYLVSTFDEDLSDWDVSNATDMFRMFGGLRKYTGKGLEYWNVEKATNMRSMFSEAYNFQGNISDWSVSKAMFLKRMFSDSLFNVDISSWDVSNVEDLGWMFYECSEFNQDLSRWNVRKVKDFAEMFSVARSFNSNISGWNVENAVTMEGMFARAFSFNQDLSAWDIRQVDNMYKMFDEAREFNQSLCAWGNHLNPNANVTSMFRTTKCFSMTDPVLNSVNSFADGPICYPC